MIEARLAKLAMVGSLAAFALLVAWNNVADYDSNHAFVRHVLAMDTVFPGNRLVASRAIADPALWTAAYAVIIAAEALTGLLFAAAALCMAAGLRRGGPAFARGKRLAWLGGAAGFLLWFLGFMVIGGEWFTMWQSAQWNGQQAAFRFYATILGVLIFVAVAPD
jgi:predicted small integral membrane protein